MRFPTKYLFMIMTAQFLAFFTTCPVMAQMPGINDLQNLPGLRTRANTSPDEQSGMEVGNINVPARVTEDVADVTDQMPAEPSSQQELLPTALPITQILFDSAKLDPNQYILGPDDQLLMYLFGALDKEYILVVLPEGIVNIPTVGPVVLAGMRLTQAKEAISREVLKKYKGVTLTVTLSRPRYFRVFASGQVRRAGAVNAHALMRVSDIIGNAGLKPVSSERFIVVHRDSGDVAVDLVRYRRFSDLSVNPYVNAGDRIEVMPFLGRVYLYGQVNGPGRFELKSGDRILDMVMFAGGLTNVADSSRCTLTRFDDAGKEISQFNIDLRDALVKNPDAPQYVMQESDRLSVWAKYQYKRIDNVTLRGEVKYPGTYPITSSLTTLSEIIGIAGGFTDNANLEEASFIRQSSTVQDLEYQRLSRTPWSEMTDNEKDYLKSMARSRQGEISLDFVKLFRDNDSSSDIPLQSGDVITVPVLRGFVNVMGAVQQPGFMRVEEGKAIDFYINNAGGYSWNAHKSGVRIIKARTGQRFRVSQDASIEPGDTIQVPEKKPVDVWASVKDGAMVFANVATILILAKQLTK